MSSADSNDAHLRFAHRSDPPLHPVGQASSTREATDGFLDSQVDLVLAVSPKATGTTSPQAQTQGAGPEPHFSEQHSAFIWWLAGLFNAAFWPTAWSRSVAQSLPPRLLPVVLGGLLSLGVACLGLWLLASPEALFSLTGVVWAGWGVLASVLWLAVLVKAQGWAGEAGLQRFWASMALSMGGLAGAVLWWVLIVQIIRHLSVQNPAVQEAWGLDVGQWVAAWLAASAFAMSAWVSLRSGWRLALACLGFVLIMGATTVLTPFMPWLVAPVNQAEQSAAAAQAAMADKSLVLTQGLLERQQYAFVQASQALQPPDPKRINLYGIVFAPFAGEAVFRNEANMLQGLLSERFGAQGRVFTMLNHLQTAETTPWATRENLFRAVQRVSQLMDKERDILFVYLTSHGGRDHKLAVALSPLTLQPLAASDLRVALDMVGIRHRVIAVSACYSGGWVGPLQNDHTLVMTAADATHTSYGCGHLSELTYFGRAVFDEQLRQTRSFETAFRQAVPLIRQREEQAGKEDGFSNPQISVGPRMAAHLKRFEAQWPAAAPATSAAAGAVKPIGAASSAVSVAAGPAVAQAAKPSPSLPVPLRP